MKTKLLLSLLMCGMLATLTPSLAEENQQEVTTNTTASIQITCTIPEKYSVLIPQEFKEELADSIIKEGNANLDVTYTNNNSIANYNIATNK